MDGTESMDRLVVQARRRRSGYREDIRMAVEQPENVKSNGRGYIGKGSVGHIDTIKLL